MGRPPGRIPVDSDDGQELLGRGWDATKSEFQRNLNRVKEAPSTKCSFDEERLTCAMSASLGMGVPIHC